MAAPPPSSMTPPAARPLSEESWGKRIIAFIGGSRGDCQPFTALILGLQRAGFVIRIITNANNAEFMASFGLDAVGLYRSTEELVRERPAIKKCMADGNQKDFFAMLRASTAELYPLIAKPEFEALEAFRPDLIVGSALCLAQAHNYSCAKNIPAIMLDVVGAVPSGYGVTMVDEPAWFPRWARRLVWLLITKAGKETFGFRMELQAQYYPEMKPFVIRSIAQALLYEEFRPEPVLCGNSPLFIKRRPDWPPRPHVLTGHWIVPPTEQERRMRQGDRYFGGGGDAELAAFLEAGATPVYMGWGSMISVSSEHMACLAVRAAKLASMRAVILGGWAELSKDHLQGQPDSQGLLDYAGANVYFAQSAAHEWLFPRCAAIVHHGGAGTVAAAMRSGRPMVITPCGFDQGFNGALVEEAGVGVRLQRLNALTAEALAAALKLVTEDPGICARAKELAAKLKLEDGVARGVEAIDDFMSKEVATGVWAERRERFLIKLKELEHPGFFKRAGMICLKLCTNSTRPLVSL